MRCWLEEKKSLKAFIKSLMFLETNKRATTIRSFWSKGKS